MRFMQSVPEAWSDEQLLAHLISRNISHRGTDVCLDLQAPLVASDFCIRSLDPTLVVAMESCHEPQVATSWPHHTS